MKQDKITREELSDYRLEITKKSDDTERWNNALVAGAVLATIFFMVGIAIGAALLVYSVVRGTL